MVVVASLPQSPLLYASYLLTSVILNMSTLYIAKLNLYISYLIVFKNLSPFTPTFLIEFHLSSTYLFYLVNHKILLLALLFYVVNISKYTLYINWLWSPVEFDLSDTSDLTLCCRDINCRLFFYFLSLFLFNYCFKFNNTCIIDELFFPNLFS